MYGHLCYWCCPKPLITFRHARKSGIFCTPSGVSWYLMIPPVMPQKHAWKKKPYKTQTVCILHSGRVVVVLMCCIRAITLKSHVLCTFLMLQKPWFPWITIFARGATLIRASPFLLTLLFFFSRIFFQYLWLVRRHRDKQINRIRTRRQEIGKENGCKKEEGIFLQPYGFATSRQRKWQEKCRSFRSSFVTAIAALSVQ